MKSTALVYGAFCGALVFAVLSWLSPRTSVGAAVLSTPPEGRFQLVQLHQNASSEWSAVLDTETGCTWVYQTSPDDPDMAPAYKSYIQILGDHSFGLINFDTTDYAGITFDSDNKANYASPLNEISRVQRECSQARLQALKAAAQQ